MCTSKFIKNEYNEYIYKVNDDLTFKIVKREQQKYILYVSCDCPRFGYTNTSYHRLFDETFKTLKSAKEEILYQKDIYLNRIL